MLFVKWSQPVEVIDQPTHDAEIAEEWIVSDTGTKHTLSLTQKTDGFRDITLFLPNTCKPRAELRQRIFHIICAMKSQREYDIISSL